VNEVALHATPRNALTVLLLAAVVLSAFAFIVYLLIRNRAEIKDFMADFPTQGGGVVVALTLIFFTGLVVIVRLALGAKFPDNYDTWIWALVALAGVTTAGMVGKRATDIRYKQAGSPKVNVEAPSVVKVGEQDESGEVG
jgi:hypothetical protein